MRYTCTFRAIRWNPRGHPRVRTWYNSGSTRDDSSKISNATGARTAVFVVAPGCGTRPLLAPRRASPRHIPPRLRSRPRRDVRVRLEAQRARSRRALDGDSAEPARPRRGRARLLQHRRGRGRARGGGGSAREVRRARRGVLRASARNRAPAVRRARGPRARPSPSGRRRSTTRRRTATRRATTTTRVPPSSPAREEARARRR